MTPMAILKPQLEQLSEALLSHFKETNLNKAQPKTKFIQTVDDEYHNTFPQEEAGYTIVKKAVTSDFLKLFQGKSKHTKYSIGVHFSYMDRQLEEYRINVSLKTSGSSDSFYMTDDITLEDFKKRIADITPQFAALNREECFHLFQTTFPAPQRKYKM